MNTRVRSGWGMLLSMLLAACATTPRDSALPAISGDVNAHQQAREQALAAMPTWVMEGRVAIATGDKGGSAGVEWLQTRKGFDVRLSAPVTRQSWRLTGSPQHASLLGMSGGPREGVDAQALLREATGWDVPVQALAWWLRGARAPGAVATGLTFGADGRLAGFTQQGWELTFSHWRTDTGGQDLPMRIQAQRPGASVKLIVDSWAGIQP